MKKMFLAFMAIATLSMVMVGCKKNKGNDDPEIKKTVPEVAATEGAVTIVWNAVNYSECNGLVFAGSYNDYGTDAASMVKFEKIEGYTNWYKAVVTPKDPAAEPVLEGKPCALAEDGTFPSSWNYQWIGSEEHPCELISGDAEFAVEYETETKIIVKKNSSVIFVRSYGFKEDPCVKAETYTINFTLNVEAAVPADKKVAIVGDFPEAGWKAADGEALEMTRVSDNQFTIAIEKLALGKEYKYIVVNVGCEEGHEWDLEMYPTAPAQGDTCVAKIAGNMTVSDVMVIDNIAGFVGVTTELPFCEEEKPEPSKLTTPDVLYLIGNVNGNDWTPAEGIEMTKEGDKFSTTISAQGDGTAYFAFTSVKSDDWNAVNAARVGGVDNTEVTAGGEFDFVGYGEYNFTAATGAKLNVVVDFSTQKATFTPAN